LIIENERAFAPSLYFEVMNMAIDITGFQRMRREQEEKAQAEMERKEAEAKCQKNLKPQSQLEKTVTSTSTEQTNTSKTASTPKDGAKPATQTKKKPSGRQQKK